MIMLGHEQTCPIFKPLCKDLATKPVLGFSASRPSKVNMLKFVQSSSYKTPVPSSETQQLTSAWNRRTTGMVGGHFNTIYPS